MVAGSGLVAVGSRRKVVAGAGLVAARICWYRKVDAGAGLVTAGAKVAAAGAGRWSPMQDL